MYRITHIQLFDYVESIQTSEDGDYEINYSYSANVIINDKFIVQVWGNEQESGFDGIADSDVTFWDDEASQDKAYFEIDDDDLLEELEENGFENNAGWLADQGAEIMNPENASYRKYTS